MRASPWYQALPARMQEAALLDIYHCDNVCVCVCAAALRPIATHPRCLRWQTGTGRRKRSASPMCTTARTGTTSPRAPMCRWSCRRRSCTASNAAVCCWAARWHLWCIPGWFNLLSQLCVSCPLRVARNFLQEGSSCASRACRAAASRSRCATRSRRRS